MKRVPHIACLVISLAVFLTSGAGAAPYTASGGLQTPAEVPNPDLDRRLAAAPTPGPSPITWNPEGQEFSVYGLARDALVAALSKTRSRLIVASPLLADGDLATALLAARLRGVRVRVLLDSGKTSGYLSRHAYLAENKVETYLRPLRNLQGWTTLVLDDEVWEFNAALDDRVRGAVRLVPSPHEAEIVEGWFASGRPVAHRAVPSLAANGAKVSTKQPPAPSATIERKNTVVRGTYRSRGLPRETRLRLLESGALRQESGVRATQQGSPGFESRKPDVSAREADLP